MPGWVTGGPSAEDGAVDGRDGRRGDAAEECSGEGGRDAEPFGELAVGDGAAGCLLVVEGGHAGADEQLPGRHRLQVVMVVRRRG